MGEHVDWKSHPTNPVPAEELRIFETGKWGIEYRLQVLETIRIKTKPNISRRRSQCATLLANLSLLQTFLRIWTKEKTQRQIVFNVGSGSNSIINLATLEKLLNEEMMQVIVGTYKYKRIQLGRQTEITDGLKCGSFQHLDDPSNSWTLVQRKS